MQKTGENAIFLAKQDLSASDLGRWALHNLTAQSGQAGTKKD
jgi:hypothetical protein